MEGKSVAALAEVLARTPPDRITAKYFHLGPEARVQSGSSGRVHRLGGLDETIGETR